MTPKQKELMEDKDILKKLQAAQQRGKISYIEGNDHSELRKAKVKELMADDNILQKVQNAPNRRIYFIDVGEMPITDAKTTVEDIKNSLLSNR